jgi:hypothetical protein
LTKKAHPGVESAGNIDIFLRPLSLRWAFLPQTSNAPFMGLRPSCLVATHHWDMVSIAISDHAWRFAALVDEVS